MHPSGRLGHARRLVIGFVAIAGGLTIALGLLSWRFIALEEDLDEQRILQRLETANDSAVSTLSAGIAESERWLQGLLVADDRTRDALIAQAPHPLPPDSIVLVLTEGGLEAYPRSQLIYYPLAVGADQEGHAPPRARSVDSRFAEVDALEYREKDFAAAAARLGEMAESEDETIRAAALLRLGRVLRRLGDNESALAVYEDLGGLENAWVEDLPAPLWARVNRCEVLEELGRTAELQAAAGDFLTELRSGRWPLTAGTYRFYAAKATSWVAMDHAEASGAADSAALAAADREAMAAAVEEIWQARGANGASTDVRARSMLWAQERPFVILAATDNTTRVLLVAGPRFVAQRWAAAWEPAGERQGVKLELVDVASGRTMYATRPNEAGSVTGPRADRLLVPRTPAETGLPWSVHVTSSDQATEIAGMARQRDLLFVGLALVTCILLTSVYFISRAVNREFEVARVQSDFVAAVSHEFRSPLTSMRHMIELLGSDRVPDDATRSQFYGVLGREANRLQRLIEQLLDFRRLDEGAVEFDMEAIDATAFVEGVAAAFRDDASAHGAALEVSTNGSLPGIHGDHDALARALWNLLENAVRYSPDCATVWLGVATVDDHLAITVRDRGIGIPRQEQATIFRKFVRGSGGQRLGARGTGLGLAMVDEIVRAHAGEVLLDSKVGEGSTFTIMLPLEEPAP